MSASLLTAMTEVDDEILAKLGLAADPAKCAAFEGRRSRLWANAHKERRVREWANRKWKRHRFSSVLWKATVRYLKRGVRAS